MKTIYLFILLFGCLNINSHTTKQNKSITGKNFEGYIFLKEYRGNMPLDHIKERYTPSQEDILIAEKTLKEQLANLNESIINQGNGCPIVHKKLKRYKRQYVGFINPNGEKVIWINCIWDKEKDILTKLDKEIVIVLDGCSYFWNVKVNIDKRELFDLRVNGSA